VLSWSRMADDPLFELLMRQSVTRLREMQSAIRNQRQRLDFEDEYVARALAAKGAASEKHRQSGEELVTPKPTAPRATRTRSARGDTRGTIKRTMATDVSRVWLPSDVEKALADGGGPALARAAIRNAMKRMVETGELRRPPGPNPQGFLLVENGTAVTPGQDELSISTNGSAAEIDQAEETAGFQPR
jgi:hypothetical protein